MRHLLFILLIFPFLSFSQSSLTIELNGLEDGDSAKVKLTSSYLNFIS